MSSQTLAYYSFDKVCSYNAVYNFIVGARGLGKTYGAKKRVIRNYITRKEQFIYLRRYSTELKSRTTFFADIFHEFPEWDFKVDGMTAYIAPKSTRDDKKRHWEIMGYFMQLSNAQSRKSIAYPRVTTIIFDEFIIEKGLLHYLPDEAKAFNDLYSTVDRYKDKTKVFFLANSVSIMNPYFLEYEIRPDEVGEFVRKAEGFIVAHFADSAEFSTGVYKTRFGRFIQGTEYADYSVSNDFADNHDNLIEGKPSTARYHCTIESSSATFAVWVDTNLNRWWILEKRPKRELLFTLIPNKMGEGKTLLLKNDKILMYLRAGFRNGRVMFANPKVRNAFLEIAK